MKILIIGGVAGGASAAARLRRLDEDAEIVLFEKGKYISYANCGLPYYIGEEIKDRDKILLQTPEHFKARFNVDVRVNNEVLKIDRENKKLIVRDLILDKEYIETYDKLILSPGAESIVPSIDGVKNDKVFTLRDVVDSEKIKDYIKKYNPKNVVVVGGGYIGLEMAENLVNLGMNVTTIEMSNQVIAPLDFEMASEVHYHLRVKGVNLYLEEQVVSIDDLGDKLRVNLKSGINVNTDFVILSIGVKPDTRLAIDADLSIGATRGILVDEYMRTSDKNIYAVGDAVEVLDPIFNIKRLIPLAGPANKQARIVANNIVLGDKYKYLGTIGTAIAKVFDLSVAVTGYSEKYLKQQNISFKSVIIHQSSHAGYYPNALPMIMKMLFLDDGKILGAQIIGYSNVDKHIDTLAFACGKGMTVYDLMDFEHAYAPPFSSAKSPVNMLGFVADNILSGNLKTITWQDIETIDKNTTFLLDVRDDAEVGLGKIFDAYHIPLDNLRARINEIPKDKKIYVYCAVGLRGYIAARILMKNGFRDVYNLSGGYKTWEHAQYRGKQEDSFSGYSIDKKDDIAKTPSTVVERLDVCGVQCPGPIMKLNEKIKTLNDGDMIEVRATDPGFFKDVEAWCNSTGNVLVNRKMDKGIVNVVLQKNNNSSSIKSGNDKTIVVFDDSFDRVLASFVIANGALAMGRNVTMFFTFWGLNVIKKQKTAKIKKDVFGKMFGFMLPKGYDDLSLSKLNMGGIGPKMMKFIMKNKNIDSLEQLITNAKQNGVRILACQMSMDVMGIKKEELLDGVEVAGVATYLDATESANLNLFI